jgi:hypothetical protein
LILPYALNMGDFGLGALPSSLLISDPNQAQPSVIAPYSSGSYTPTGCRIVRIPIPTSGVGNNTQAVGFPFPAPLPIPQSGRLVIAFSSSVGQSPPIGSGDNRQDNFEFGIYREVGDTFADWIGNSVLNINHSASYYRRVYFVSKSVDTADYSWNTMSYGGQIDFWIHTRIYLDFDTGEWTMTQWIQRDGFFKFSKTAAAGKLAAWAASDEGAPIAGIFMRNTYTTALSTGVVNLGGFWIGWNGDATIYPHNSLAMPASINHHVT